MAAYGLILPDDVLAAPRLGCLNVHPSLLPKYRGPSPVSAAILAGDEVTGATVMEVTDRVDAGPVVARRRLRIGPGETAGELTARLFHLGGCLTVAVLPGWAAGEIQATSQDESEATMTRLLTRDDGEIDWSAPRGPHRPAGARVRSVAGLVHPLGRPSTQGAGGVAVAYRPRR